MKINVIYYKTIWTILSHDVGLISHDGATKQKRDSA